MELKETNILEKLSDNTKRWAAEKKYDEKKLWKFACKELVIPDYARWTTPLQWFPSQGTRFATGDDIDRILKAFFAAYGRRGEEYVNAHRVSEQIRASEIVNARGFCPTFCYMREKSDDELVFMLAKLRLYRINSRESLDIEYFWVYEWVSTVKKDSVQLIILMKDLRQFYGHICSLAGRPLNVRAEVRISTSMRARNRFKKVAERELAARGMASTFKFVTRTYKHDDRVLLAANNSLNKEMDTIRRKQRRERLKQMRRERRKQEKAQQQKAKAAT